MGEKEINRSEEGKEDLEKPEEIIDEINSELTHLHDSLIEGATQVGEQIERYSGMRGAWVTLGESSTTSQDLADVVTSGIIYLSSVRNEVKQLRIQILPSLGLIHRISPSTDTSASITGSTAGLLDIELDLPDDPPFAITDRYESTRDKLAKLDESLALTYEEIRQVLYGTHSDPERGALYMLRQAYDHFFGLLAPDDDVRDSKYWEEKEDSNPNLVTRAERIEYAAHTHIADDATAKRLAASANHMTNVYRSLNRAHERGEIDAEKARTALKEMQTIIDSWVEALDL